jgi:hypothetical protein
MGDDRHTTGEADGDEGLLPIGSDVAQAIFYLGIGLWGLYLLQEAWAWQRRDRLVPLIVLGLLFGLIGMRLAQLWKPGLFPDPSEGDGLETDLDESESRSKTVQERYALYMTGWTVALVLLVFFVGFMNALVVFVPTFVYFFKRSVRMSLAVLVAAYALTYVLFIIILQIYPWTGHFDLPQLLVRVL